MTDTRQWFSRHPRTIVPRQAPTESIRFFFIATLKLLKDYRHPLPQSRMTPANNAANKPAPRPYLRRDVVNYFVQLSSPSTNLQHFSLFGTYIHLYLLTTCNASLLRRLQSICTLSAPTGTYITHVYLVVVAHGVALHAALHLDGERQIPVDIVDQRLKGARHQPKLLREVAAENAGLRKKGENTKNSPKSVSNYEEDDNHTNKRTNPAHPNWVLF